MSADIDHAGSIPRTWQSSPLLARLVMSGLLAGLIAAVAWGVVLMGQPGRTSGSASQTEETGLAQARRDVQLAVSSFAANFNNYSVDDIGGYKQRMIPLMTKDFATSFKYAVDGIVTEVKATEMTSTGEVVQTAISSMDAQQATVLVVADVDVSSALGERQRHFRWKVSVIHEGDDWLVDDFQPVA